MLQYYCRLISSSTTIITTSMVLKVVVLCALFNYTLQDLAVPASPDTENFNKNVLPPCRACKTFAESFQKGLSRTEKGQLGGGNTAWEEKNMNSYSKSEIRLTEIQEKLCSEVEEGKEQCYTINENHEADIEDWWFNKQDKEPDFFKYFCIDTLKDCCPTNHFGPNCNACPGHPDRICSGNGKCKGAGTRKGSGDCNCDAGYGGNICDNCAVGYYESYKDDTKLLCSKCHPSCDGPCTKAGAKGCIKCKSGYISDQEKGCLDVNECASGKSPCTPFQFCVNTDGSYQCLDCDKSCKGCTGDGPDMCIECAKDFLLIDKMCVDLEQETRKQRVVFTRYLTYLGLCIATCIILNKNTYLAAIVGIAVAIYISLSEYILNSPPTPNTDDIAKQLFATK